MSDSAQAVYIVTVIRTGHHWRKRVMGFYHSFKDAEEAVLSNELDMFEREYQYATIEQASEGIYPDCKGIQWYKADHTADRDTSVTKIEAPSWAEGIVNWGIG